MNKKAVKGIIGALVLAILIPTVVFVLTQEDAFEKLGINGIEQQEMKETQG
ncbi:hypothetical protein P4V86_12030 [Brevibacillus laterosporus]|uniref:hypothetical protein n=1 Tax=Brevibacillus laterosporus TaxID=1465 RepID=UPI00036C029C|nr:hypothetical protein [Brevibacillus laterosporus]MED2004080.1 hypothetical protein [Brevibacillus laterosporus]MED4763297.1 hypothetical protein [Brevibacillus laterosporus]